MRVTTLWVVYEDAEHAVHCEPTTPQEIADYCMDIGIPQWVDQEPQFYTDQGEARTAYTNLKVLVDRAYAHAL